jgi:lysophospholipase L1-like esterase
MVQAAQKAGATVWLVSPLPNNATPLAARKLHDAEATYASKAGVPFLDTFPTLSAPGGRFKPGSSIDGRHPTPAAAKKLARSILAQATSA